MVLNSCYKSRGWSTQSHSSNIFSWSSNVFWRSEGIHRLTMATSAHTCCFAWCTSSFMRNTMDSKTSILRFFWVRMSWVLWSFMPKLSGINWKLWLEEASSGRGGGIMETGPAIWGSWVLKILWMMLEEKHSRSGKSSAASKTDYKFWSTKISEEASQC